MIFIGSLFFHGKIWFSHLSTYLDCMVIAGWHIKKIQTSFSGALKITSNYVKSSTNSTNLCREGQKICANIYLGISIWKKKCQLLLPLGKSDWKGTWYESRHFLINLNYFFNVLLITYYKGQYLRFPRKKHRYLKSDIQNYI